MSRFRKYLASAFLLGLFAGHAWDVYWTDEHWPFSSYPMFRTLHRPEPFSWYRLMGVTAQGKEITIWGTWAGPMQERTQWALKALHADGEAGEQRARQALAATLWEYESRRAAGKHRGPPLVGLRFYRLTWAWTFDPRQRDRQSPQRELVFDYRRQEGPR